MSSFFQKLQTLLAKQFPPTNDRKPSISFKERFAALRNLPPFFRDIWQTNRLLTVASIVLRLFRAGIPALSLYIGKLIIDEVVIAIQQKQFNAEHTQIWWWIGAELGLAILADLLGRATSLTDSLLGDLYANRSSIQLMQHASKLDLEQFEDPTFYDKLERARQQTVGRTMLLTQTLAQFQDFITMGFLSVGLLAFNPWLMLILGVTIVPAFLGETYFSGRSYSLSHSWTPQRRELDYYRFVAANNTSAKEVKLFGLSDFLISRFRKLSLEYYQANRSLAIKRASWGFVLSGIGTLGYYSAYLFIVSQTLKGTISIGSLTFLAGSFRQLRGLLESVLGRFTSITQGALYLKDLFDFFAIEPQIVSATTPLPIPSPIKQGFVFENVGFRYPNSERWACRNLSFTLQAGEKLALVGENGAGKTTLVKLITRLYDPDEGRILLDGQDLKNYNLADLQAHTGVIFQDYLKFSFTASDNIAVGDIEQHSNTARIEVAAEKSLAASVINKLPKGYQQVLGRMFKEGADLSGGEWQKIALARAYMREAQLYILDEPTSALDARAEYEVFQRFSEITEGKMALLISHRFSTVRMADRILVLENGQLLELGTHEELLALNGRYAELFQLQAKGYQ